MILGNISVANLVPWIITRNTSSLCTIMTMLSIFIYKYYRQLRGICLILYIYMNSKEFYILYKSSIPLNRYYNLNLYEVNTQYVNPTTPSPSLNYTITLQLKFHITNLSNQNALQRFFISIVVL